MAYTIKFTRTAKIEAGDGLVALEERARGEIAIMQKDTTGEEIVEEEAARDLSDFMLHVFETPDGKQWIAKGGNTKTVLIDVCEYRKMDTVFPKGHPFYGKTLMMPYGVEDDDAQEEGNSAPESSH